MSSFLADNAHLLWGRLTGIAMWTKEMQKVSGRAEDSTFSRLRMCICGFGAATLLTAAVLPVAAQDGIPDTIPVANRGAFCSAAVRADGLVDGAQQECRFYGPYAENLKTPAACRRLLSEKAYSNAYTEGKQVVDMLVNGLGKQGACSVLLEAERRAAAQDDRR